MDTWAVPSHAPPRPLQTEHEWRPGYPTQSFTHPSLIKPIHGRILNLDRRARATAARRRLPSRRLNPIHLRQPHTPRRTRQRLPIHSPVALRSRIRPGRCRDVAHAGPVQQ